VHSGIAQRKNLLLVEGSGGTEGTENELLVGVCDRGLICALSLVVDIASLVELLGRSGGKGCDAACNDPKSLESAFRLSVNLSSQAACLGDPDRLEHYGLEHGTYPLSSHGVPWPLAYACMTQLCSKSALRCSPCALRHEQ
jgi:hypothetical protein